MSKAYRELETKGLIVGRPGQGTFILATLSQVALPELTGLRRSLRGWLAKADAAGLDESGIAALVASELRDFYERRGGSRSSAAPAAKRRVWHEYHRDSQPRQVVRTTKALDDCNLAIPEGHVAALVGPNGAGKSTLLNIAVGLATPTSGELSVLGGYRAGSLPALDGIGFVAQDTPMYKNLSAADMLHLTRNLNRHFDQAYAEARSASWASR